MMALWSFKDWITGDSVDIIQNWLDAQDDTVQANFDTALFILRNTTDWLDRRIEGKRFKVLSERHTGLCELIIDIDIQVGKKRSKRHIRPAGIWRPDQREFILLIGCEKWGRIYAPPDAFERALEYKARFEQGEGITYERI